MEYLGIAFYQSEYKGFACDGQGDLYIAMKWLKNGGFFPWFARKITSTGEYPWGKELDDSSHDEGVMAMALDPNANSYYTGIAGGAYETHKLTRDGTNVWTARYFPSRGLHQANAVAVDVAGNAYVTGRSTGTGTGNDYATIKYGPTGQELWVKRFTEEGNSDDQAHAIAVSPAGEVYVTGFSNPSAGIYEITTIKYVELSPI